MEYNRIEKEEELKTIELEEKEEIRFGKPETTMVKGRKSNVDADNTDKELEGPSCYPAYTDEELTLADRVKLDSIMNFDFMSKFMEDNKDFFQEMIAGLAYVGFDPVKMRAEIEKVISRSDIMFLIHLGATRGNSISKVIFTMRKDPEVILRLKTLRKKLKIKDAAAGNPRAVTLPRITACFPDATVTIMQVLVPPMALSRDRLLKVHAEFPNIARSQSTVAAISHNLVGTERVHVVACYLVNSLMTSEIIAKENVIWDQASNPERAERAMSFIIKAYDSSILTEEQRSDICTQVGVTVNDRLSPAWTAAGSSCEQWVREKYSFSIADHMS